MHKLIKRHAEKAVRENLEVFPAVLILGSRQCGKSTLVKMMLEETPSFLYLDLQDRDDIAKLEEPGLFFQVNENKTICLDEIQYLPELFSVLRSEIDKKRITGRFILLGSASRDIIQHTSESLAGRIGIIELTPFLFPEVSSLKNFDLMKYWYRGGYPDSYLAVSDSASDLWRENFLRTYVERDVPQLGFQIPARQIMRMLMMCAHNQGQLFNASKLGESLGLTHPTIKRYLDLLEQTFILRSLPPYELNVKKRLVKSPKVYLRDSGLLHSLLQIKDFNTLMSHPVFGSSWEGLVIENICATLKGYRFSFYRSARGEEIDLIIHNNKKVIAVECKATTAPKLNKGFLKSLETVRPDKCYVIALVKEDYPIEKDIIVCSLKTFLEKEMAG
jgi:predicted AAA+ superfamily ATPase